MNRLDNGYTFSIPNHVTEIGPLKACLTGWVRQRNKRQRTLVIENTLLDTISERLLLLKGVKISKFSALLICYKLKMDNWIGVACLKAIIYTDYNGENHVYIQLVYCGQAVDFQWDLTRDFHQEVTLVDLWFDR